MKVTLALIVGLVVGVVAGFIAWGLPAPLPPAPPSIELKPAKSSTAQGVNTKPPEHAYSFEVGGAQFYFDSNGWISVAPLKDKMPGISIHNKGNDQVDVAIQGKPRAVITVRVAESRIQSFSLENGTPGNRATYFDMSADGGYDFLDVEKDGQKSSEVFVDGGWYSYASEGGKSYAVIDGQLHELTTGESGVHFKAAETAARPVDSIDIP